MTAARPLAIGLVQLAMGTDTGENVNRAVAGVREAARKVSQQMGYSARRS